MAIEIGTRETFWTPGRDKYGRSCQTLIHNRRAVGAVVKLPKAYTEKYGPTHLANDWTQIRPGSNPAEQVTYHQSLKSAKAVLEAVAAKQAVAA